MRRNLSVIAIVLLAIVCVGLSVALARVSGQRDAALAVMREADSAVSDATQKLRVQDNTVRYWRAVAEYRKDAADADPPEETP